MIKNFHITVLLNEAIQHLAVKKGGKYIDATVGGGGHAEVIVKKGGHLLGIDCDPKAVNVAKEYLKKVCPAPLSAPRRDVGASSLRGPGALWKIVKGNFSRLEKIAQGDKFGQVDGVLFDLGVSSYQLETSERGLSFLKMGPLDMRMDPSLKVTAADLVNALSQKELKNLFIKFGEERRAQAIARAIVNARSLKKIKTTRQLAEIVVKVYGGRRKIGRLHPATKAFQALRIAVNDELNNLKKGLLQAEKLLKRDGRLVVISFHGLEDRITKIFFRQEAQEGRLEIITKKPIRPSQREISFNPRSRSAKLRVARKL